MTKQISLYRSVVNFINQFNPGQTYTSQDFKIYLGPITRERGQYAMNGGQWYRVRSYQSYLHSIGMLTNVSRGVWKVNYNIPEWMSLTVVETLKGYKDYKYSKYTGHYTKDKNAIERRESYASALKSFKAMSDKSKTPQPKFNIGDKVICVATEKIPSDGRNFMEARGIQIGDVLTVKRPSEPYTHSDRSLVIEFKEKGSLHLASNFKIWIPIPPKTTFKPKVDDRVKLVSKTSDFYADAKEYIDREKLTLGSTYTVSKVCHNGKPDEWADMFVRLKEGRSGSEFNIPVDCFEPVTPKQDKYRDYTGTRFYCRWDEKKTEYELHSAGAGLYRVQNIESRRYWADDFTQTQVERLFDRTKGDSSWIEMKQTRTTPQPWTVGTVFEEMSSGTHFRIVKRANATGYMVDKLLDPAGDWSRTQPMEYLSFTRDEITGNMGRIWSVRTQTLKSEVITAMAHAKDDDELRASLKKILA